MLDFTDTLTLWLFANSTAIIAIAYWFHQTDKQAEAQAIDMQEFMDKVRPHIEAQKNRADAAEARLKEVSESHAAELKSLNDTDKLRKAAAIDSFLEMKQELYQLRERIENSERLMTMVQPRTKDLTHQMVSLTDRLDLLSNRMNKVESKILTAAEIRVARLAEKNRGDKEREVTHLADHLHK
ncbi:hypothetical protein HBA55_21050 [Pseudomaricurvus alkylphenolicus]|uniref:hypothetical protein n=1 Tax=Pseudomaricurvus alkylphenolicus TaxID=1306991 RepID=UPI00141F0120|nr:hypothetical protein [Pseudomaricurvus alkylphenolicus]NIB42107.1 hypothetical protein [Pseudomaricurvus alkylphenolicus]